MSPMPLQRLLETMSRRAEAVGEKRRVGKKPPRIISIGKMFFNCNFIIVFHHITSFHPRRSHPQAGQGKGTKIVQFSRLFMQVVAVIKMGKKVFSWLCKKNVFHNPLAGCECMLNPFPVLLCCHRTCA